MNKKNFDLPPPLAPLPGLCPGPTGGLKRLPDPTDNNFSPPFLIPGYGPDAYKCDFSVKVNENQKIDATFMALGIYLKLSKK